MNILDKYTSPHAAIYHGDCIEGIQGIPNSSIDFSVFSPPFSAGGRDLFVYSASDRDLGNSGKEGVFEEHMGFLAKELFRVMKPGRMVAIHCMDIAMTLGHHGEIGFFDFPGDLRQVYSDAGFIYSGRITIWKDPVIAQERTHARQLVHHEMVKDSSMSGVGCPDYILLMRKRGVNAEPIAHVDDAFSAKNDAGKPEHWQRVASPVWAMPPHPDMVWATSNGLWKDGFVDYEDPRAGNPDKRGIDHGDTLNFRAAREHDDERHLCPLQRGVVKRLLDLYTNKGDVVLTPFLGVGTEVVCAVETGRRGVGFELKPSYYRQAVAHVKRVEPGATGQQTSLLDLLAAPAPVAKRGTCGECAEPGDVGACGICGGVVQ